MGAIFSSDPNRVDILMPGCGGFSCGGRYATHGQDTRLTPYLSNQEYVAGIESVNRVLDKAQTQTNIGCVILLVIAVVMIIPTIAFASLHEPAYSKCAAPNGECPIGVQDPAFNQCCAWYCCDRGSSAQLNPDSCRRIDETRGEECECTGQKKQKKCKVVDRQGEFATEPEKNGWAAGLAGVCGFGAFACVFGSIVWLIANSCSAKGKIINALAPWAAKGLRIDYFIGSKHSRPRIMVYVPSGANLYGAPAGAVAMPPVVQVGPATAVAVPAGQVRAFTVSCPPNTSAGATVQVQAPDGSTVQVVVPEGVQPGGVFSCQY